MSIEFTDGVYGRARFDLRTGETIYAASQPLLPGWVRLVGAGLGSVAACWLALQASAFATADIRRRRLERAADECKDIVDRSALLYALSEASLGGFMTNASILATARDTADPSRVLFFATGGWTFAPHTLAGVPLYPRPDAPIGVVGLLRRLCGLDRADADSAESRARWWTALTLGKSTTLNGALAFTIATQLLEQERSGSAASTRTPMTLRGKRITNVGLCTGSMYPNLAHLNQTSPPLTSRLDLACEIGTLQESLVAAFQQSANPFGFGGGAPDLNSPDLAAVCAFGSTAVLDSYDRTGRMPAPDALPGVVWDTKTIQLPQESQRWSWVEVEGGERFALDACLYFEKGIAAPGFRDDDADDATTPTLSWFQRVRASLTRFMFGSLDPPLATMPRLHIVPLSSLSSVRQFGARVTQEAVGARSVIRALQDDVLVNSAPPNAANTQMRALLRAALKLWHLPARHLMHRIDTHPDKDDASDDDDDDDHARGGKSAWGANAYRPASQSKPRSSRSARNRRQKKAANRHGDEDDEDDARKPSELDQVD